MLDHVCLQLRWLNESFAAFRASVRFGTSMRHDVTI